MNQIMLDTAICAFGSDARESYKADIYRSLTLPLGAILHYRYKFRYVSKEVLDDPSKFQGQNAILFFSHILNKSAEPEVTGTPNTPKAPTLYRNHSIRWAEIHKIEKTEDTELLHVYFKLGDFCDIELNESDTTRQPGNIFFGRVRCKENNETLAQRTRDGIQDLSPLGKTTWASRIKALSEYFPKLPFYYIKSIKKKESRITFNYDEHTPSCHYPLTQGADYFIELAVSNINASSLKIKISEETGELIINHSGDIQTTVEFDDYNIPIFTKPLSASTQSSVLRLCIMDEDKVMPEYDTGIDLKLELSLAEPLKFGLASLVGAASLMAVAPRAVGTAPGAEMIIAASIGFTLAAGYLFYNFNKK